MVGRPKGKTGREVGLVRNRILAAAKRLNEGDLDGIDRAIDALFEKAIGVLAQDVEGRVYRVPPDPHAAKLILEMLYGKPKQQIEITDPEEKFRGLPQLILVPPAGFGKRGTQQNNVAQQG